MAAIVTRAAIFCERGKALRFTRYLHCHWHHRVVTETREGLQFQMISGVGAGAERNDQRGGKKRQREQTSGQLRYMAAGKRNNSGTDHHAGIQGNSPELREITTNR